MVIRKCLPVIALLTMAMAPACRADLAENYESTYNTYGDIAESYVKQVPLMDGQVKEIHSHYLDAWVDTTTNIRKEPSHETESLVVIDIDEPVKVLGFTDNNWTRVYCVTKDAGPLFGYIRGDLLYPESVVGKKEAGQDTVAEG